MNQSTDAAGNPTANIVNVARCGGCPAREAPTEGPYRWNYDFIHNPNDPLVRRDCRSQMSQWMTTFTIFTACPDCMEAQLNIGAVMLNAP